MDKYQVNPFVTISAIKHDLKNHIKHTKYEGIGYFGLNENLMDCNKQNFIFYKFGIAQP